MRRERRALDLLNGWCADGPAKEPVVECEVPVEHGHSGENPDLDVVEVPVGLVFECERLRSALRAHLLPESATPAEELDVELVEALSAALGEELGGDPPGKAAAEDDDDMSSEGPSPVAIKLPWVDLAALAQLTYWYDRRPRGEEEGDASAAAGQPQERNRDAKYGRWTKKLNREKVVYGTVALRYRTRGHLGAKVFRRPAGVDVTRLGTLRRAAALCGHGPLGELVEDTMEKLRPKNVAKIPWEEVQKHTTNEDLWLMIDSKVYDVTPFLGLHPGGGHLIVEAAGKDSTSLFEMTHGEGLRYSLRLLNQFFIGVCDGSEKAEIAEPTVKPTPEFLSTLRSITGALHTFDEAKATGEAQGMLR